MDLRELARKHAKDFWYELWYEHERDIDSKFVAFGRELMEELSEELEEVMRNCPCTICEQVRGRVRRIAEGQEPDSRISRS